MNVENADYYFLKGGGEMGGLIRATDWSKTPLGDPEEWPESLRTVVAVMLDNPFGMYIAWGKEYIQLYNDGYRPILGSTKHPQALGISTRETFSEIWHIIESMFDGVMNGKAVGFPDFMLPLNRNGFVEECYFDFSYSPIRKKDGEVGGVLVTVIETTNKKKAEEDLKLSQQRFYDTVKQAPVGITILRGKEYLVEMANDAYLQLVDRKESEFVGRPLFDSLPEVEDTVHVLLDNVFDTGTPYHGTEYPIPVKRYGKFEVSYFDFLYHPLKEEDGKISGIIVTVTDVSSQVIARLRVEDSEKRFRSLIAQSPIPMAIFKGPEHIIEMANDAMVQRWDKRGPEFLNKKVLDVFPEIKDQKFPALLNEVYSTGNRYRESESLSYIMYKDILKKFYIDFEYTPLRDTDGTVSGIIITVNDVTEKVEARKKIEESEERFRSLAESLPQLIWETDEKGNALFSSGKWEEYTGIKPAGATEWQAVIHPDDLENSNKIWMHSLETGDVYKCDVRIKNKIGDYRWHTVIGEPVLDQESKIKKWVGAFTNIHTEKEFTHELEKQVSERTNELEQKNIELEKMNKELQSFAYISSHDLQEPLRKIQTFTSQIMEKEFQTLSDTGKDRFQRMQNAAQRMQTLIEDLLAYSRTSTSERKFERINLKRIIEEVKEDLKEELQQKHAIVEANEMCSANIIPFQFRQLIYNLISNSLKFYDGKNTPQIKIKSKIVESDMVNSEKVLKGIKYCHITVSDNGIGFEQQYNEKIFEVFQRLHSKDKYAGTGIGLSIVKKIVENHNGVITAKGELGKGATFEIFIPA